MKRYDPKSIEPKWQKVWAETGLYEAKEDSAKPKAYVLDFFPYPSGNAMHIGHVRNYTISDTVARYERLKGKNVLHPMGWDAFGLPTENYAIKTGISPQQATQENTDRFRRQLRLLGYSYDWTREINSSSPDYYKWTEWFFLLLFKRGLAVRQESLVNWDPVDQTVLANEQVVNGKAERSGAIVEKRRLSQWFFKITEYADRLINDLDGINWPESIKAMQRNWIGKSVGAEIRFKVKGQRRVLPIFTTRHDTQYGVTFLVLAPEHAAIESLVTEEHREEVEEYLRAALSKSEIERMDDKATKTGVFTGSYAINPINDEEIPIWVADYVLMGYGTGAVMGVPAHDDRDYTFAKKYKLEIRQVLKTDNERDFHSEGLVINSGRYNGMRSERMREEILHDMVKSGDAVERVNYKLRDWLISRQRYWGAPIPIVWVDKYAYERAATSAEIKQWLPKEPVTDKTAANGTIYALPVLNLPVELPEFKGHRRGKDMRGPLSTYEDWVSVSYNIKTGEAAVGKNGGDWVPASRETDTQDGFACSSWYFLRFADPRNKEAPFTSGKAKYWLPVDMYIGGAEHAVMHLLYARFWTKVMFDEGMIDFEEPFTALRNQGMLLAEDGRKISKRLGNIITPEEIVEQGYGADALRTFELFIAPFSQTTPWSNEGLAGTFRFLQRVWTLIEEFVEGGLTSSRALNTTAAARLHSEAHRAIRRVTEDLEDMAFNTAVAALMELVNALYKLKNDVPFSEAGDNWREVFEQLTIMLAPFAPHLAEELWHELGNETSVHAHSWPAWDASLIDETVKAIVVQVNGKVRASVAVEPGADEETVKLKALAEPNVQRHLGGKEPAKTIVVSGKLVNFVVPGND